MKTSFSPRRMICIFPSAPQKSLLSGNFTNSEQNTTELLILGAWNEVISQLYNSQVDAILIGSGRKPGNFWQQVKLFRQTSPYFPMLFLYDAVSTQEKLKVGNFSFPKILASEESTSEHLLLKISRAILQEKMNLHELQYAAQWEMLNQLETRHFSDEAEFVQIALDQCRRLTQSQAAFAILLDENLQINNILPAGGESQQPPYWRMPILQHWIDNALEKKIAFRIPEDSLADTQHHVYRGLVYPVIEEEKPHCILILLNKVTPYHERDLLYVRQATGKIWQIIKFNQVEQSLEQRLQEMEALDRIASSLRQANSRPEFLQNFLTEILTILHSDVGAVLIYDEPSKRMHSLAARGWIKNLQDIQVHIDQGISGRVFRSGRPVITERFKAHPDLSPLVWSHFPDDWGGACFPIFSSAKVIGVLFVCIQLPRVLTQSEIWLLGTLVEFAGNTLMRLRLGTELDKTRSNLEWEDQQLIHLLETLSKDREMLNITLMEIGEGVIRLDENHQITLINHEAEIITGYASKEALGAPIDQVLTLIDPKTNDPIQDVISHLSYLDQLEKGGLLHHPPTLLNKFNKKILITGNVSPIHTPNGGRLGSVIVMKDVTEQAEIQSQMALLKKMEAIGQLATGIAHEINTPIQYIFENLEYIQRGFSQLSDLIAQGQTFLEMMPEDHTNKMESAHARQSIQKIYQILEHQKTRQYLQEIPTAISESLEGIEQVRKIIVAIREFSHPSDYEKKPWAINHAIHNIVTISKNEWKYVADLVLDLEPDLPLVYCRLDEINQAILNMITNAAQAIEDDPSSEKKNKGKIILKTWHDENFVYISIGDTGCGINEQVLDRIFDPFFTTKEIGKGTGQGLFIAHNIIVKKHQGKISVTSKKNEGSTFVIQLPIHTELV